MTKDEYPRPSSFRIEREMIDVTSMNRADTSWCFRDAAGHLHQWHDDDGPAKTYSPSKSYRVPTLIVVQDDSYWCEDCQDTHETSHLECAECREWVVPGRCADTFTHYVPGLMRYYIDDRSVTREEFDHTRRRTRRQP